MKTFIITIKIWFLTSVAFGAGCLVFSLLNNWMPLWGGFLAALVALVGSLPAFFIIFLLLPFIRRASTSLAQKKIYLFLLSAFCSAMYGFLYLFIIGMGFGNDWENFLKSTSALLGSSLCAQLIISKQISAYFYQNNQSFKQKNKMETNNTSDLQLETSPARSNKILIKASITGALILLLLIPTIFIANLVEERKQRQAEVVTEVSTKWAGAQVLTGPYLFLPYKIINIDKDKKVTEQLSHLIILPEALDVTGQVSHQIRLRSIYKVLLYKAALKNSGHFKIKIPKEIDSTLIQWQDAKICYGLSDFKGIEEKMSIQFNGAEYELSPGLPSNDISQKGLSANIPLSIADHGKMIAFQNKVKIKGSEKLHFVPLAGDSRFTLKSDWASPSFDGNNLPSEREVNDSGFTAAWNFNKANLPFGTTLKDFKYDPANLAFGVTMVQPADGYAKTDRCIKYAILFIGLTFSLFFIIELLQKKPIHPVQYILIGLALIIFYTLLLSMSEFIPFDNSYLVAALATILLISFYAYGHFRKAKTTLIFGSVLALLYSFTFVLIRLEDTALLIGSIGLFMILALAMYASRKINWYGTEPLALERN